VSGVGVAARVLLFAGVGVVVLSSLSAVWLRGVFVRLHFLTPVTSVGGPLIGLGLAVENGWGITTGIVLLVVALLALTGPVVEVATGRVMAQREGLVSPLEEPQ
jgi:multicomponent Na+:H+ antiporter subunit G